MSMSHEKLNHSLFITFQVKGKYNDLNLTSLRTQNGQMVKFYETFNLC